MRTFGKSQGGGRRNAARAQAPLLAILSSVASDHRAAIMNLSLSGARFSAPDLPAEGEKVAFRADTVQAFGTVVWSRGRECGVVFETPLAAGDVERLRRAADLPPLPGLSIQDRCASEDWNLRAAG
jgi:PilZ domain